MKKKRLSAIAAILFAISLLTFMVFAGAGDDATDAMTEIDAAFSDLQVAERSVTAGEQITLPLEITCYYDKSNGAITNGYYGTPVIVYVVNTLTERVGTDSDVTIIGSMLERGYVVAVFDYKNNEDAVSPVVDLEVQIALQGICNGSYLNSSVFPSGNYYHTYVVPAGHNILLDATYWEIDKHGSAGTLESIVASWNNDLRGVKGNTLIPWVYSDGSRKKVDKAIDGSSPVWYDSTGAESASGTYTRVKWTVAEDVTDCVNPDGTPISLDLNMTVIYPTSPEKAVPVMCQANSSGELARAVHKIDRPHQNTFLFNGYAFAVFDHGWIPMSRDASFGYYDGNDPGGVTNDALSYTLQLYNDKEINTAAMRFLRYLSLSEPETYVFDTDAFGVYGNSKGGWFPYLGEAILQKPLVDASLYNDVTELERAISAKIATLSDKRVLDNHYGESRYENGETESYERNGVTVDGGELQPWLTYNGVEIISGAQCCYASCGSSPEDVSAGHTPMFISLNMEDGSPSDSTSAEFCNVCRNHDVPTLFFEVFIGHTLTIGEDGNYGVDTYEALFDFCGYYLKGESVKVAYVSPKNNAVDTTLDSEITVKFIGAVSSDEVAKITVTDGSGKVVNGEWRSEFGNTEWIFTPYELTGGTVYTVTVPADICGDNGLPMGEDYRSVFTTEYDVAFAPTATDNTAATFTVPALPTGANRYVFRFTVKNDAANIAELYETVGSSEKLIGTVNLLGSGVYEIDVTDYIAERAGESITLTLKPKKAAGIYTVTDKDFASGISGITTSKYTTVSKGTAPDGTASLKVVMCDNEGRLKNEIFYPSPSTAFIFNDAISSAPLTRDDYGRRLTVTVTVYDDISRLIRLNLSRCGDPAYGTVDYNHAVYNLRTEAGEWKTLSFEYSVTDSDYGERMLNNKKILTVYAAPDGEKETPMYFGSVTVTETVTDIVADGFTLAVKNDGGVQYKAPTAEKTFALIRSNGTVAYYDGFAQAMSAYAIGDILTLTRNYTLTDGDLFSGLTELSAVNIDLNGYTVTCENTKGALLWAKNNVAGVGSTVITVKNGGINIGDTPLISYADSTASGKGKSFAFGFENVRFGITDGAFASEYITASTDASGAATTVDITLTDCDFTIPDSKRPETYLTILPVSSGDLTVNYEVSGGSFRFTSQRWITVQDDAKSSVYTENAEGEYTVLLLPTIEKTKNTAFATDKGGAIFTFASTENGYTTYTLKESELSTIYGMIPEEYADVEKYPWVVFDGEGALITATNLFAADNGKGAIGCTAQRSVGEWYIVLRRDYTYIDEAKFNNFGFIWGDVTIDLNGHTLTNGFGSGRRLFEAYAKSGSYATLNVINGTIDSGSNALIRLSAGTSNSYDGRDTKTFTFNFKNVAFTVNENAQSLVMIGAPTIKVVGNINFEDCSFDLTDAKNGFTLIDLYDAANLLESRITVKGGEFISDTFEGIRLYGEFNLQSGITFVKDKDGEFAKAVTTAVNGIAPTDNIPTTAGNMRFTDPVTENGVTTYSLAENNLLTPYGTIPEEYADAEKYPFLLFIDGAFHSAYTCWADSSSANGGSASAPIGVLCYGVKDNIWRSKTRTCTVLLRRDYAIANGNYNNLSQINGTVTVDLGGYTLTAGSATLYAANKKTNYNTTITTKNGTILLTGSQLVNFGQAAKGNGYGFHMTFEDVNIGFAKGATSKTVVGTYTTAIDAGCFIGSTLKFINCNIDLKNNAPGGKITFIDLASDPDNHKTDLTVSGGNITLPDNYAFILTDNENCTLAPDSIIFTAYNGAYTTLTLSTSATAPAGEFDTDAGRMVFMQTATASGTVKYELSNLSTPYGSIPAEYADAEKYPFVLFIDGVFHSAYTCWADSSSANGGSSSAPLGVLCYGVKDNIWRSKTRTCTVLLRRDYVIANGNYNNLSQINGTVTIDLGGHTLTAGTGSFYAANKKTNYNTTIITKNGTILLTSSQLVNFSQGNKGNGYGFHLTFEDLNLGFAKGATSKLMVGIYTAAIDAGCVVNSTLNFVNCNIDLKTNAPGGKIVFIDLTADPDNHSVDVSISGGSIILPDNYDFILADTDSANTAPDTVIFTKYDGKYITVNATNAPAGEFNTEEGAMQFIATENASEFTLAPQPVCEHEYDNACDDTCNKCGEGREVAGHSYNAVVTAPTCTAGGYTTYTCTVCGNYYISDETAALGHNYNAVVTAPTCTEGGYTTYTCACGESYVADYTEALGHAYDDDYDADCNNCGEIREVEIPVYVVAEGKCGVNTTWVLTSDGVLTISGNGDTEDYLVNITKDQPYRAYQDMITKVVFEDGVTSIGRGAFYGFTNITEVVFPESLIAIHEYAFFGCSALKSIVIPENTTYIGMYAFRKAGIIELTMPMLEAWEFTDGTKLDIDTMIKAFTTEFTYKQTCIRPIYEDGDIIAEGVFGNKDQFSWTLTSTGLLTVRGNGAMPKFNVNTTPWYGYRGAIRSVVIEEGITSVGRCAFHTCRAITSVTLPESLETIAEYAFYNCQFLTEATIPANVTRIEIYAFRKCFALKDVTFTLNYGWTAGDSKVSATELNSNAADMLTLVNYTKIWTRDVNAEEEVLDPNYVTGGACNTTVKWALTYIDDTKTKMKLTISGTGAMPKFETAGTPWYGYLNDIVEVEVCEGITEIGRCSFYGLKFVKVATIANTVTSINDYAFSGCFSLKSIEIPASVTYIAETAFTKTGVTL